MRILVLTSTYSRWPGDTEPKFVDNLCLYLSDESEVHVVAPHAPHTATREVIDGVLVNRFRYCWQSWETLAYDGGILPSLKKNPLKFLLVPGFIFGQLVSTMKLLRKNQYDVIHAHWIIPQGLVAVLARMLMRSPPRLVVTSHGGDLFALKGRCLSGLKKWVIRKADHLTVVSSAMKSKVMELGLAEEGKTTVVPMGVDTQVTFKPPEAHFERQNLLFVGRLVDKKGIEYLIRALPELLANYPELDLTVIGDGPMKQQLLDLCLALNVGGKVNFIGPLPNQDIPGYFQRAAITVFPSIVTESGDQEGTPVAIMEALACECAAIVSDYPGARDIIKDGENGLLIPQRSAVRIAESVAYLLQNPDIRNSFGREGRKAVQERYDWRVISSMYLCLFQANPKLTRQCT